MALAKMDSDYKPTLSQAHPETMDFLSQSWCNFAVQALHPDMEDRSLVLQNSPIKIFENDVKPPSVVSCMVTDLYLVLFLQTAHNYLTEYACKLAEDEQQFKDR